MVLSYWQTLLTEQRKRGKRGFTIPFIIGSQTYLIDGRVHDTIEDLIVDIVTNNLFTVFLKYCIDTDDLILEIKPDNSVGRFPKYNNQSQSRLFVSKFNDDLGDDVEAIIQTLSERYQGHIDAGKFSINDRQRGSFSNEESKFISFWFQNNQQ